MYSTVIAREKKRVHGIHAFLIPPLEKSISERIGGEAT